MNQFSFVGEIKPIKDTEKFKGQTERVFDSGWVNKQLRWNLICGDNSHLVEINAGYWGKNKTAEIDVGKNVVYTLFSGKDGAKAEKQQVKFADRMNSDIVEKVPQYKRFVVDLNLPGTLKAAEEAKDNEAIEAAKKKRHEFIAEIDFLTYVAKLVQSDKIKGMKFKVRGEIVLTYSASKDTYYRNFIVQKIYRAEDDAVASSDGIMELYFGAGCVDSDSYDVNKKHYVSAYTPFYDSMFKKNFFAPVKLVISGENDEKIAAAIKKKFDKAEGEEIRKIGVGVTILDGAQSVQIDESMLTEEQKEDLECGLLTMEQIRADLGGSVKGDRVQETRVVGLARGYSKGSEATVYTLDNLKAIPSAHTEEKKTKIEVEDDDLDIDLELPFSDEDDNI